MRFDAKRLSPIPVARTRVELPFDLRWQDLRPWLPEFDEVPEPQAFRAYAKQGLDGGDTSTIITLVSATRGDPVERSLFIKRAPHEERLKHLILAERGIPTPVLITSIARPTDDVLVFEFLPKIGIDFAAPDEIADLLTLIARVNALTDVPAVFDPRLGMPRDEFETLVREAFDRLAVEPVIGVEVEPEVWMSAYRRYRDEVPAMGTALNHGELFFQQIGWSMRQASPVLCMFDLETMSCRARFTDIASILRALAIYSGSDEGDLFEQYRRSLSALTGEQFDLATSWRELRAIRFLGCCESLPWLTTRRDDYVRGQLEVALATASEDLSTFRSG